MGLIIKFLQFVSRIINKLIPYELQKNNLSNPSGVYKLLVDENDKVTYKILGEYLRKSIPFDNYWKTRDFAINLALLNQRNHSEKLFYLEFGVYKGESTNFFSNYLEEIYAFDSFEGLKEDWKGMTVKGAFKLKKIPKLNRNVFLIVGWVENTLEKFLEKNKPKINFVHMDMDLYKPTVFTLQKIKPFLIDGAIILFDEFYNYLNWQEEEYKALIETFEKSEYKFKAYTVNQKQVCIQYKKI